MDEIAILMAAGMGTRMQPLTQRVPKPLVKVHGIPMIETIINGLEKRNVKKIYIVVGYLKEQFYYLQKKYENIEIIENIEYLHKNNISSLYAVKDILGKENCFICEADLYVSDISVFDKVNGKSCYYGKFVQGYSNDWIFEVEGNRISRIGKGGMDTYNMVGISYWIKGDAEIIRNSIENAYKEEGHEQLFWDEIVNRKIKEIDVEIVEVSKDSIVEIDTLEELKEIDSSYC